MSNPFFEEQSEQSLVKATIVSKYFARWARIMIATTKNNESKYGIKDGKIAYLDLFAGPGRYKEGSKSTPLMILEQAIANPALRERLVTIFNDKDESNIKSLEGEIYAMPGISSLRNPPQIMNHEVGTEMVKMFDRLKGTPTLFFVDPFGYKGLSLQLINSVLQNWGCDCIFFFNYNRISMGLPNEAVRLHMDALFGEENAEKLRRKLEVTVPSDRELVIVESLAQSLRVLGGKYVLPFRFRNDRGSRTSHHLVFVSKGFRGYEEMKEVMAEESTLFEQGVPSFEYNPATERQPFLFELSRPLDDLGEMILREYAGRTLRMAEIYEQHNVDRPFIRKNYKEILMRLEEENRITVSKHRKNTFGDNVIVTFPDVEQS